MVPENVARSDQALTGNYTYFLFDLESDPYETTNLYYSSDDDAQNATVSFCAWYSPQ